MTKHISRDASISFNPKRLSGLQSRRRFGAANQGKRLDGDARRAVEDRLRQEGQIS
jgi:hypothetical protein